MPPLGSCLSASHHPSVGRYTASNRSRIASAAVHTHTARESKHMSLVTHLFGEYTYLVLRDSRSQRFGQSLRQSSGMRQGRRLCARDRGDRARRGGITKIRRSRGNACPSRQRLRRRRRPRVVVGLGKLLYTVIISLYRRGLGLGGRTVDYTRLVDAREGIRVVRR